MGCRAMLAGLLCGFLTSGTFLGAAQPPGTDLLQQLRSEDESARIAAIDTLGSKGARIPGAVAALIEQLKHDSARVRVHAADALGRLGPAAKPAINALAVVLADSNLHVRRAAVRALKSLRADPQVSIPLFMRLLEDTDPAVRLGALDALAEAGKPAVPPLIEALGQPKTAYLACLGLGEMGPVAAPAVAELAQLLKRDRRPEVRREAMLTLGSIGKESAEAVPQLVGGLNDADPSIRMAAVFALGRIGPEAKAAESPLKAHVKNPNPLLQTLSVWALARINPDDEQWIHRAVPLLMVTLRNKEPGVRAIASRALVDLRANPEILLPPLDQVLQAGGREVAPDVLNVLASLGEPAVPSLIQALKIKEAQPQAAALLARLGPRAKAAAPDLIELAKGDDPTARREALMALGAMGPAAHSAVPVASEALADADPEIRYAGCFVLGKIGPPALAAKSALQEKLDGNDPRMVLVAAWALAHVDPECGQTTPKSVPPLIKALEDPEALVRLEAAASLRCMGPGAKPAATALEKAAREDPAELVRDMAREALKAIKE